MTADDIEVKLGILQRDVEDIRCRVKAIEDVLLGLRLHEARNEWLERVLWIAVGCVVPIAVATVVAAVRFAP